MNYYIKNALVYHNHRFETRLLHIKDGKIHFCQEIPQGAEVLDAAGQKIVPGFIDIHTHGAVGVDVNAATKEDLAKIGRFFASNGTTGWLGSVLTDTQEQTEWCLNQFNDYYADPDADAAELLGTHLEGPFLAYEYKGAMPEHLLQKGNTELLRHYQNVAKGHVRYLTCAPEVEGVNGMISAARSMGIHVGIGHSAATYDQACEAIDNGAELCTHTFNAMRLFHQHEPAIMGAVLERDVFCEMICDGLHLVPATVRMLMKLKGPEHLIGITDSIMAAGLPDGDYKLGVNDVVVKDGDAKLKSNGVRAGSTLTQNRALKNLLRFTDRPLEDVLPVLTENPAKLLGLEHRIGRIADGMDADLVLLDENNDITGVYLKGRRV